ncbi:hypothetical protein Aduo_002736 [Ancylostoma duodenale]
MDSMECYALRQNYTYIVVNGADHKKECPQEDITFQRHCIVAHLLNVTTLDWIFFVDSDIGVVNENVRLENMLDSSTDIIFYDRMFNHEVMAGSYISRRSNFSVEFLKGWANYEGRLPNSFHGRDNGAIHMWLVEQLQPTPVQLSRCRKIWNTSTDYGTLSQFTVCCRELLNAAQLQRIAILRKGKGWARDGWLTNSHWNPSSDFMFHARKEADKKLYKNSDIGKLSGDSYFPWFDTLKTPLNMQNCRNESLRWDHDSNLIVPSSAIFRRLNDWRREVRRDYSRVLNEINEKFGKG